MTEFECTETPWLIEGPEHPVTPYVPPEEEEMIRDTFEDTPGGSLDLHDPDVNGPGNPWREGIDEGGYGQWNIWASGYYAVLGGGTASQSNTALIDLESSNVEVEAFMQQMGGMSMGVIVRAQDHSNFISVELNHATQQVEIVRQMGAYGTRTVLASSAHAHGPTDWFDLLVTANGDKISVWINNIGFLSDVTVSDFQDQTNVGLIVADYLPFAGLTSFFQAKTYGSFPFVVHDTFLDGDGVLLTAHTPEVGGAYIEGGDNPNNYDILSIRGHLDLGLGVPTEEKFAMLAAGPADGVVRAQVAVVAEQPKASYWGAVGIAFRGDRATGDLICALYRKQSKASTLAVEIFSNYQFVSNIGQVALPGTFGLNDWHDLVVVLRGDEIKVYDNYELRLDLTESTGQTQNHVGLAWEAYTDARELGYDDLRAWE